MRKTNELIDILRKYNAKLVRNKKHEVWKFPDGRVFIRASTPSDWREEAKNLCDLKNLLGITSVFKAGERREKKFTAGKAEQTVRLEAISSSQKSIRNQLENQPLIQTIYENDDHLYWEKIISDPKIKRIKQ